MSPRHEPLGCKKVFLSYRQLKSSKWRKTLPAFSPLRCDMNSPIRGQPGTASSEFANNPHSGTFFPGFPALPPSSHSFALYSHTHLLFFVEGTVWIRVLNHCLELLLTEMSVAWCAWPVLINWMVFLLLSCLLLQGSVPTEWTEVTSPFLVAISRHQEAVSLSLDPVAKPIEQQLSQWRLLHTCFRVSSILDFPSCCPIFLVLWK